MFATMLFMSQVKNECDQIKDFLAWIWHYINQEIDAFA